MNKKLFRIMDKRNCKINVGFLPMKMHYFLYNGALSGVIPFLPVIALQLGISHADLGVIYGVLPFLSFIAKPTFGSIADNLHQLKPMLMLFLLIIMFATMGINFIPPLNSKLAVSSNLNSRILCSSSGGMSFLSPTNDSCIHNIPNEDLLNCSLSCYQCETSADNCPSNSKWNISLKMLQYIEKNDSGLGHWGFNVTSMPFDHQYMEMNCSKDTTYLCNTFCDPSIDQCPIAPKTSVNSTLQFWTFFILAIAAWVSCGISVSLSDAACFNILKDKGYLYGRQRLWGTVGWGSFVALAGYAINKFSSDVTVVDYSPGFYILFALIFLDLIAVYYIKMDNLKMSKSILKDVVSLLKKPSVVAFIISVFIIGALTAILWSFLFLHLRNLGAEGDLLGFVSGVQCIGELPFFFFSGWLISKIGHVQTLTLTLASFGIRYIGYSYLTNPWWVLPIELLQGLTFGAFYTAMASYASIAAPPGTEVTMQGLVGGAFEGLGMAAGGVLGGFTMGRHHGRGEFLFFWAGILAFVACGLHIIVNLCLNSRKKKSMEMHKKQDMSPNTEESTTFI